MKLFIGVDPGASGAIAGIDDDCRVVQVIRLSQTEREVAEQLGTLIGGYGTVYAFIERVGAMPKQGVSSSFKFGQSYGFLRGILTASMVPFEEVTPQKWQGVMGCRTKGDKNVTKQKAGQFWPMVKVFHWNADALLLAEYCRMTRLVKHIGPLLPKEGE